MLFLGLIGGIALVFLVAVALDKPEGKPPSLELVELFVATTLLLAATVWLARPYPDLVLRKDGFSVGVSCRTAHRLN